MPGRMPVLLLLVLAAAAYAERNSAALSPVPLDLLAVASEWQLSAAPGWQFKPGLLTGQSAIFDGEKTDPAASAFLESRRIFGGDKQLDVELEFETGRYLGVYLDYDPVKRSGIWMATGHVLPEDEQMHHVASAYIKTVEGGHWIVRATGQLDVPQHSTLSLRFERIGDDYRIWQGDRLVVTYRKPGGYQPGILRLRLVNAAARLQRLEITAATIAEPDSARPAKKRGRTE